MRSQTSTRKSHAFSAFPVIATPVPLPRAIPKAHPLYRTLPQSVATYNPGDPNQTTEPPMDPIDLNSIFEAIFAALGMTAAALAFVAHFAGENDEYSPQPVPVERVKVRRL